MLFSGLCSKLMDVVPSPFHHWRDAKAQSGTNLEHLPEDMIEPGLLHSKPKSSVPEVMMGPRLAVIGGDMRCDLFRQDEKQALLSMARSLLWNETIGGGKKLSRSMIRLSENDVPQLDLYLFSQGFDEAVIRYYTVATDNFHHFGVGVARKKEIRNRAALLALVVARRVGNPSGRVCFPHDPEGLVVLIKRALDVQAAHSLSSIPVSLSEDLKFSFTAAEHDPYMPTMPRAIPWGSGNNEERPRPSHIDAGSSRRPRSSVETWKNEARFRSRSQRQLGNAHQSAKLVAGHARTYESRQLRTSHLGTQRKKARIRSRSRRQLNIRDQRTRFCFNDVYGRRSASGTRSRSLSGRRLNKVDQSASSASDNDDCSEHGQTQRHALDDGDIRCGKVCLRPAYKCREQSPSSSSCARCDWKSRRRSVSAQRNVAHKHTFFVDVLANSDEVDSEDI